MIFKIVKSTLLILYMMSSAALAAEQNVVNLGHWNNTELSEVITIARQIDVPGDRIVALSHYFIETPYTADTLIGGPNTAEQLVINLAGFDCYTLLDVIEALRRAADLVDFPEQLKQVRYRDGVVTYDNRRHFFSDWVAGESERIGDVTTAVGQGSAQAVVKQLNLKSDGTHWLPGLPVIRREISYIPTISIDHEVLSALQAGDYVGIYTEHAGLDVSHTGLLDIDKNGVILRHASSQNNLRQVVDVDLLEYLQGKPGLVVYRPR